MLQNALVPDEHDDDVRVRVVAELLQPPRYVDVRRVLRDVVHKERTDRTAVVPGNRIARSGRPAEAKYKRADEHAYAAVMAR